MALTEEIKRPPAHVENREAVTSGDPEATSHCSMVSPVLTQYVGLVAAHAQELSESAIPPDVASAKGIYSAQSRDDLPADARYLVDQYGDEILPAIVYPMVHPDGSETWQVKPVPGSVTTADGSQPKYIGPARGKHPVKLPFLRGSTSSDVLVIVEGTKQALSVLAWSPSTWSVYGIPGIQGWSEDGAPTPYLAVVAGKDVVIVPDADAKTNVRVFDGATALGEACEAYGAKSVNFARVPGAGKDGVDDLLGRLPDQNRSGVLSRWVGTAKAKPADLTKAEVKSMRAEMRQTEELRKLTEASGSRQVIDIEADQLEISLQLTSTLREHKGGTTVFARGEELARIRRGEDGVLRSESLRGSRLQGELLEFFNPIKLSKEGPKGVLFSHGQLGLVGDRYNEFPSLTGITQSPVVRKDGTLLIEEGYDPETGLILDLSEDIKGIDVPEHPSDDDIAKATRLIRDELLAMDGRDGYDGWVFQDIADQTNMVAALATPLLKTAVGCSPIMLFNGIQPGVGKGEAVNTVHLVAFGETAPVTTAPRSDTEMDKRLLSEALNGASSVVLDEVQDKQGDNRLDSNSVKAFVTSEVYGGRRLGESEALRLPNNAVLFGLGNNIQIPADLARRVMPIRFNSDRHDLENRDNFRHNLRTWVPEHRAELLRALLIIIRAWYDRGQPAAPRTFEFASFVEWQRVIGGILHLAGFEDFLGNMMEVREYSDSEAIDNRDHLEWVESHFPAGTRFSAADVMKKARVEPDDAPAPYKRSWEDLNAKALSTHYGQNPKWFGDLRVREAGKLHRKRKAFVIERLGTASGTHNDDDEPSGSSPGTRPAAGILADEAINFTDHKGFTQSVSRVAGRITGKTIAELGGGDQ